MKDDIKKLARSGFGFNSIVLHKLGYTLEDQAKLTSDQKDFIIEAYKFYQEKIHEESDIDDDSPGIKNNMKEVKRQVMESGRRSNNHDSGN